MENLRSDFDEEGPHLKHFRPFAPISKIDLAARRVDSHMKRLEDEAF